MLENVHEAPLLLSGAIGGQPVGDGFHLVFAEQAIGVLSEALDQMTESILGGGIDAQLVHGAVIHAGHARGGVGQGGRGRTGLDPNGDG